MKTPRISIILPSYNGARFLPRAIASVLAQDYSDWELLIVDDGSTDGTCAVAEAYAATDLRIRVLLNGTNQGIQKSLNRGLREARGEYVARIDDDDTWLSPSKLSRQAVFLGAHPDHILIGTGTVVFNEEARETMRYLAPVTDAAIRLRMLFKNCFTHSGVMFRKDAAISAGGYNEDRAVLHVEDYALWLKLGVAGKLHNLPSYDTGFTAREGSLSAVNKRTQLKKTLDLIAQYRSVYPGYRMARGTVRAKIFLLTLFGALPPALRGFIFARYKAW